MTFSRDCTPGWATDEFDDDGYRAFCGCGWSQPGFPSKRKALAAQKEHRFPGPNPKEAEPQQSSTG